MDWLSMTIIAAVAAGLGGIVGWWFRGAVLADEIDHHGFAEFRGGILKPIKDRRAVPVYKSIVDALDDQ